MTSSSQRLIDLYRLSELEELTKPSWAYGLNGVGSFCRGRTESNQRSYAANPMKPPAAPEVPRGPPISYRNTSKDQALPQRSFSQRAKARPFADEVFAENGQREDLGENGVNSPLEDTSNIYENESASAYQGGRTKPLHVDTDVGRGHSVRQTPRSNVPVVESPQLPPKSQSQPRDTRRASETIQRHVEARSATQRSSTMQYPASMTEEQRREWAPDRSPLQKLEVTLNDISKEEKRARVEEAEMLLLQSKAGRGSRRTSRHIASPAAPPPPRQAPINKSSEPTNAEDVSVARGLSSKQHDRLHHSATIQSRKPNGRRLSAEGRGGLEYQEQEHNKDQARPVVDYSPTAARHIQPRRRVESSKTDPAQDQPNRQQGGTEKSPVFVDLVRRSREQRALRQSSGSTRDQSTAEQIKQSAQYALSARNKNKSSRDKRSLLTDVESSVEQRAPQNAPATEISDQQTPGRPLPTNVTRAVSLHKPLPPSPDEEDVPRPGPMREANSSHKAALANVAAGGSGPLAAAAVSKNGGRKLQKSQPKDRGSRQKENNGRTLADSAQQFREAAPQPVPVDQSLVQQSAFPDPSLESTKVEVFQRSTPRQIDIQKSASQRAPEPVGLGLRDDSTIPATSHQHHHHPSDVLHQKPRRQSVSFKEPLSPIRPIDEWRNAGVATLSVADQDLEASPSAQDKAWWESQNDPAARRKNRRPSETRSAPAPVGDPIDDRHAEFKPPLYLRCGPLLRYTGMKRARPGGAGPSPPVEGQGPEQDDRETWRGSVLIVTQDSRSSYESAPTLRLFSQPKDLLPPPPEQVQELAPEYVDPIAGLTKLSRTGKVLYVRPVDHLEEGKDLSMIEDDNGLYESSPSPLDTSGSTQANTATSNNRTQGVDGEKLGKFKEIKGARLYADPIRDVTFWRFNIEVELGDHQAHIAYRINRGPAVGFWVPARGQSMNIMFHSCNGFSLPVNPNLFSGPDPLWRDVLNTHETRPFHVMIGGGDQIYNDRVMVQTKHFGAWTHMKNPVEKHRMPFHQEMKEELESFYLQRYAMWFSQGLFAMANSQIPMVNMWDDHDIIDGFGSYPDHFMRSPVFSGLGNVAFKYYMLFQHHSVPEETMKDEPSWLLGAEPGPYIHHHSRSVFMFLGKHVAFLGLDGRTERHRDEVLTNKTYDLVLERCRNEIIEGETKHLIVLLGIPIAYPRLVWLENILTSRLMDPIKALGRVGIFKGGFLNKFDGGVEILDDLDDHWTAKNHKDERNDLILDLQDLSAEKSVRITVLAGDVHLAAVGQFYSNPKLRVPKDKDHRYMPNIISSAIVNTPPPELLADLLNKRDKVHQLNEYTAEDMIPMFTHDVDDKRRKNKCLLPRRNWCSIREYYPGATPLPTPPDTPSATESDTADYPEEKPRRRFSFSREDVNPRGLFRRLSSRRAPPSSYRDDMDYSQTPRPASHDGSRPPPSFGQFTPRSASSTYPRTSFDANASIQGQAHGPFSNRPASVDLPPLHLSRDPHTRLGNFHRRPTNLSEKAARKGVVPGIDKEGNEVEVNEHINLEGGLDITLNCEVNQKDPAGITTPYRLLVPALWYDGSSDREKLDGPVAEGAGVVKKPKLLKRMGLGGKGAGARLADGQGSGNWGQDISETESYSGSEGLAEHEQRPRRRFSLFGRKRRHPPESEQQIGTQETAMSREKQMQEDYATASQQAKDATMLPSGSEFLDQRHENQQPRQDYSPPLPQTNGGRIPTGGSRPQGLSQYAGRLPPARQLQRHHRTDLAPTPATFQANEPRTAERTQVISRQPATGAQQHGDPDGQSDSPDPHQTERGWHDQQDQDPPAQPRPSNGAAGPQPGSKVARVLGEQPQYNSRAHSLDYDSRNQTGFLPRPSQSQRAGQTYYPPPANAGSGSNLPYYPPPPSMGTPMRPADGQALRHSEDGGSRRYQAMDVFQEPKKRRWSLSIGKKWIGDGRTPDI